MIEVDDHMKASDIRFAGSDPRLLAMAEALDLSLENLNASTLAGAVIDAIKGRGLPPIEESTSLFLDLWRANAAAIAQEPSAEPAPVEQAMRQRLVELADALGRWRMRLGTLPTYASPRARHAHGLAKVWRDVAARVGATPTTIKRWAMTSPEAQRLIAAMRPVAVLTPRRRPRSAKRQPLGDAGAALSKFWR